MKYSIVCLKNRLNVISIPSNVFQSVTFMVLVHTGSRFEEQDESGLAHFVEHMFFKGTKKYPDSKQIALAIENIGGNSNAFTSYDYTGYYIRVPKENYKKAIEIFSEIIKNSTFLEEEVAKESGVICEEIKMYEDIPSEKIGRIFHERLFPASPLGNDIAGTIESVKALRSDDFHRFTNTYYNSKNMILVLSGNFDPSESEKILNDNFEDIDSGAIQTYETVEEAKFSNKYSFINLKIEQTHLVIGGRATKRMDPRRYALRVGNSILGFGCGSLLFQEIREKLGIAYYVHSSIHEYSDTGEFHLNMGIDNKRIPEALDAVNRSLKTLVDGKISLSDFNRAKNLLIGHFTTEYENTEEIGYFYGIQKILSDKIISLEEMIKNIKQVELEEVVDIWKKIITPDNIFGIVLGPENKVEFDKISVLEG